MRVCLILEGCYPYVRGGVSAWTHALITHSSDTEFVLWTVHADRSDLETMLYELPPNVVEHHTVVLNDAFSTGGRPVRRPEEIIRLLGEVLTESEGALDRLAEAVSASPGSAWSVAQQEAFVDLAKQVSLRTSGLGVADAYHGLRSMLLPVITLFQAVPPEADLYHAAVTGYGGVLGALAAIRTGKPFVLTEHGIYPREREEEILTARWLHPALRDLWIRFFYSLSRFAYAHADQVTALFPEAVSRQVLIGCPEDKCRVIPNGIELEPLLGMEPADVSMPLHIGAFIRFAAIKDIKTMLRAFSIVHTRHPDAVLHLMGGTDDEGYRAACVRLIDDLGLGDAVQIEGYVPLTDRIRFMRFTVLSSISEGQPLALLESMAAGRPVVATRVGCCPGLIQDGRQAGLVVPPMRPDLLAEAMCALCEKNAPIREMGMAGRKKVAGHHALKDMVRNYHQLYREVLPDGRNRV